jgi:hypothetical protein
MWHRKLDPLDAASSSLSREEFQRGEDALSITQPSNSLKYIHPTFKGRKRGRMQGMQIIIKVSVSEAVCLTLRVASHSLGRSVISLAFLSLSPRQHSQRLSSRWLPSPPNFLQNSPSTFCISISTRKLLCAEIHFVRSRNVEWHTLTRSRWKWATFQLSREDEVSPECELISICIRHRIPINTLGFRRYLREPERNIALLYLVAAEKRLADWLTERCDVRRAAFQSGIRKSSLTKFWLKLAMLLRDL